MLNDDMVPSNRVRVVAAYEDYDAGKRAQHACQQLLQLAHLDTIASTDLWKFDMLKIRGMRTTATEEAAGADLLVVAPQDGGGLPAGVLKWVQEILGHPSRPKALLVLLGPSNHETESGPLAETELQELAAPLAIPFRSLHLEVSDDAWSEPGYASEDLQSVAQLLAPAPSASAPEPPEPIPGDDTR